ncbi:MAG: GFA family protein [Rhizobiaceae bacterium]
MFVRAVRYSVKGDILWSSYCHCESCRRQTSSPVTAFFGIREQDMMFHGDSFSVYQSSPGVERGFCNKCGTPVSNSHGDRAGEINLYTASLDFPEKLPPAYHYHWDEHLPWLKIVDELPRFEGEDF